MLVKIIGSAVYGVEAECITIEVNMDKGIGYHLVGLPDNAVKESSYRIAAALKNSGYEFPVRKVTINMAPADLRKEGAAYDLPIALGILAASGQMDVAPFSEYMVMGELSLDGQIRPLRGILPMAVKAKALGCKGFVVPFENASEAAVVQGLEILAVRHLQDIVLHWGGGKSLAPFVLEAPAASNEMVPNVMGDFADVRGQESTKRALEIAAAGGHNILLIGPPGSGKTMLAQRLPGILPPMRWEEALETTKIHSVAGKVNPQGLLQQRPFRSPHHTSSSVSLVGGGSFPQPGEISLAHNGILFLDELPEFRREVLEVLRQPLEDRQVTIARSKYTITYPASFMLVASMNPSPGGYFQDPEAPVKSSQLEMQRYLSKLSGPLLDRIDVQIEVNPVPFDQLHAAKSAESSATIRERVMQARKWQTDRFASHTKVHYNAQMTPNLIRQFCQLDAAGTMLLKTAMERLQLSARAYDRILRVARTIADLEGQAKIGVAHVAEAIQYRSLDRSRWMGAAG